MNESTTLRASQGTIILNKLKTFFSKPHNVILVLLGIILTFTTVAPIVAIVEDTFKIHAGTIDAHLTGQSSGRCSTPSCSPSAPAWCLSSTAVSSRFSSHARTSHGGNI